MMGKQGYLVLVMKQYLEENKMETPISVITQRQFMGIVNSVIISSKRPENLEDPKYEISCLVQDSIAGVEQAMDLMGIKVTERPD